MSASVELTKIEGKHWIKARSARGLQDLYHPFHFARNFLHMPLSVSSTHETNQTVIFVIPSTT